MCSAFSSIKVSQEVLIVMFCSVFCLEGLLFSSDVVRHEEMGEWVNVCLQIHMLHLIQAHF